jgi:hypothetical protein
VDGAKLLGGNAMTFRSRTTAFLWVLMLVVPLLVPACTAPGPGRPAQPTAVSAVTVPAQPTTVTVANVPPQATEPPAAPPVATAVVAPALEAIIILDARYAGGVVHVIGEAEPTFEQNLVVRVLDGAGAVLAQGATTIQAEAGRRGRFQAEVPAAGDVAMAQVYDVSPRDGQITHLASAWLDTPAAATTAQDPEAIRISVPLPGAALSGHVTVSGWAGPTFEQALLVQIYDVNGTVVGRSSGTISAELGQGGPFSIDVQFSAAAAGPGRVVVLSDSPRNGVLVHLAAVEVDIAP